MPLATIRRRLLLRFCLLPALLLLPAAAGAAGIGGTPAEAKALAERAAALIERVGYDQAAPLLRDRTGPFVDRNLYVAVFKLDGTMLLHPHIKALEGRRMMDDRDFYGRPYAREMWEIANGPGSGWVTYTFTAPLERKLRKKTTYVLRVGQYYVISGAYLD